MLYRKTGLVITLVVNGTAWRLPKGCHLVRLIERYRKIGVKGFTILSVLRKSAAPNPPKLVHLEPMNGTSFGQKGLRRCN